MAQSCRSKDDEKIETLCKPGLYGRAREWVKLGVDLLSWFLSNQRLR